MTKEQLKEYAIIGIKQRYYNEKNKLNKITDTKQKELIIKRLKEIAEHYEELTSDIIKLQCFKRHTQKQQQKSILFIEKNIY